MNFRTSILTLALAALTGCAHAEMTGDEHRAAAEVATEKAVVEQSEYDPSAKAHTTASRSPMTDLAGEPMREYNPTEGHLLEADRQMKIASKHMQTADKLAVREDLACAGVSEAERTSCPVMAPHVATVTEVAEGVTLNLKPGDAARRLAGQMRCHLAYAKANDFVSVPCPLYLKGVTITLREGRKIDIFSTDAKVASQVRLEARRMFGEAPVATANQP